MGILLKERDILEQKKRHLHCDFLVALGPKGVGCEVWSLWRFLGLLEAELFLPTQSPARRLADSVRIVLRLETLASVQKRDETVNRWWTQWLGQSNYEMVGGDPHVEELQPEAQWLGSQVIRNDQSVLLDVFGFYWKAQKSLEGNPQKHWPPAATGDGCLDGIYWVIKGKVTLEIWRT